MSITDKQLAALTDRHRLVIHDYRGDGTFETGLYAEPDGSLRIVATGGMVRSRTGERGYYANHAVRVVDPPFTPDPGTVVALASAHDTSHGSAVRGSQRVITPWLLSPILRRELGENEWWVSDDFIEGKIADGLLRVAATPEGGDGRG